MPQPLDPISVEQRHRDAAAEMYGRDAIGNLRWPADTIGDDDIAAQAFARFERDLRAQQPRSGEMREAVARIVRRAVAGDIPSSEAADAILALISPNIMVNGAGESGALHKYAVKVVEIIESRDWPALDAAVAKLATALNPANGGE